MAACLTNRIAIPVSYYLHRNHLMFTCIQWMNRIFPRRVTTAGSRANAGSIFPRRVTAAGWRAYAGTDPDVRHCWCVVVALSLSHSLSLSVAVEANWISCSWLEQYHSTVEYSAKHLVEL